MKYGPVVIITRCGCSRILNNARIDAPIVSVPLLSHKRCSVDPVTKMEVAACFDERQFEHHGEIDDITGFKLYREVE